MFIALIALACALLAAAVTFVRRLDRGKPPHRDDYDWQ